MICDIASYVYNLQPLCISGTCVRLTKVMHEGAEGTSTPRRVIVLVHEQDTLSAVASVNSAK